MNLIKMFYSRNSLKRKILDIKDDIKIEVKARCKEKFWINWYGAYEVDPKNLVFWICVLSDEMKRQLESDSTLMAELRELLVKHNYTAEARSSVLIGYESQETVDRESNGDWYAHFK